MSARGPVEDGSPAPSAASAELVELLLVADAGDFLRKACEQFQRDSGVDLVLLLLRRAETPDRYEILASHPGSAIEAPLVVDLHCPALSASLSQRGDANTLRGLDCTLPLFTHSSYTASFLCGMELRAPQEGTHGFFLLAHSDSLADSMTSRLEERMHLLEPRMSAALEELLLRDYLRSQCPPALEEASALTHLLRLRSAQDEKGRKELAQVANGIAHDNNNLLQLLESHVELLQLDELPPGMIRQGLEASAEVVQKNIRLCRQLAAFALPPGVPPEPMGIASLIDSSRRLLRLFGPRGASYRIEHLDGNPMTSVNEGSVIVALVRILQSAAGAMPVPLGIHIQTGVRPSLSVTESDGQSAAERVKIAVSFCPREGEIAQPEPLQLDEGELCRAEQALEETGAILETIATDENESMKTSVVLSLPTG